MKKCIFFCFMCIVAAWPIKSQNTIASDTKREDNDLQLTVELNSEWSALNTCRNADLLVTYRNNSEKPVMIVSPDHLHLEFRKGKEVVTKFDGFTYETNIFLWGIILSPKSEYCTKVPLRLFLKTKEIVPGEWNVGVNYGSGFEKEWVGSEFRGRIRYVRGKNVKFSDKFYETTVTSDKEADRYYLLIKKDHDERDRIGIISGTLVSNSVKLKVESCGWLEKFLWRITVWLHQL
jgi:hypothetical protein